MTKRRTKEIEEALPEIVGNSVDINLDTYEAQIIELMQSDEEKDKIGPDDISFNIDLDNEAFRAVMNHIKGKLTILKESMEQEAA